MPYLHNIPLPRYCVTLFLVLLLLPLLSYSQKKSIVDTLVAYQHYKIGDSLLKAREFDASIEHFEKARVIYEKAETWERVARCYNRIAVNYRRNRQNDNAVNTINKALVICDAYLNKNHPELAETYENIGLYHEYNVKNYKKALLYYVKAFDLRKTQLPKKHHLMFESYHNIGTVYTKLREFNKSLKYLKLASKYDVNHKKKSCVLFDIGSNFSKKNQKDSAIFYYKKSVVENKLPFDIKLQGRNFYNIGFNYWKKGNYKIAKKYILKSIKLRIQSHGFDHCKTAIAYNLLGAIYDSQGKHIKALEFYKKALNTEINSPLKDSLKIASYNNNIGIIYKNLGDYSLALEYQGKAILIRKLKLGIDNLKTAQSYSNIGNIYYLKKEYNKALLYSEKAIKIRKSKLNKRHPYIASSFQQLGKVYTAKKEFTLAQDYYQKALDSYHVTNGNHHPDIAETYNYLASLHKETSDYQKALNYYQKAIITNTNLQGNSSKTFDPTFFFNHKYLLETLSGQATTYQFLFQQNKDLKYLENSLDSYQKADQLIDYVRQTFQNPQDQIEFAKSAKDLYAAAIQTQLLAHQQTLEQIDLEKAWYYAEKSRAYTLNNLLHDREAKNFAGLPEELLELEKTLKIDEAYYRSRITELQTAKEKGSTSISEYENKLFANSQRQDSLISVLETAYPKYHKLKTNNSIINVAQVQQQLDANTSFLEFFTTDSTTYAFTISKEQLSVKALETSDLDSTITQFQESINSKNTLAYKTLAHTLHQQLLAPIKEELKGSRLIIAPDGPLWHLNFDLLLTHEDVSNNPADLSFLLKDYAVSYANSANLLFENFKKDAPTQQKRQDCLAFSFSDSTNVVNAATMSLATLRAAGDDLPGTRKEIKAIADIIDGQYYYGSEAGEANFKKQASRYNILHLALHGQVDNEQPENSKLFFTKTKDTLEDNYLYAHELFALDIPAELTVLSACNTGSGKIAKGEGIMSLGNAFQYAGTKSLLLSGWEVSDKTTPKLMQLFYQNLKNGMNKAMALQQAKLSFLQTADARNTAPFFWGGFYLVGDSAPIQFSASTNWNWVIGLGGWLVLMLGLVFFRKQSR